MDILETERLILRPLRVEDAEHIFKTWTSDPRVTEFMIYTTHKSPEDTREWLKSVQKDYEEGTSYNYGFQLKEKGKLIGSGGAHYNREKDCWMIGYNIAYDYWHKGYTSEAIKALVDHLHKEKGIKHFEADHAVDNPNSGKVMEKIGMRFDRFGSYTCLDGRKFEAKYYVLDLD